MNSANNKIFFKYIFISNALKIIFQFEEELFYRDFIEVKVLNHYYSITYSIINH